MRFTNDAGEPLSYFRFKWEVVDRPQRQELLKDVGGWKPSRFAEADADGVWHATGEPLDRIVIQAESSEFHRVGISTDPLGTVLSKHNMDCIPIPGDAVGEIHAESRWRDTVTLFIECRYEDGQPFYGRVSWVVREMENGRPIKALSDGKARECPARLEIKGPRGADLRVQVDSLRVGFAVTATLGLLLADTEHLSTHVLVIPTDEARLQVSFLEIDCTALPPGTRVRLAIRNASGLEVEVHEVSEPCILNSRDLLHSGQSFTVYVSGDIVWQSDTVHLNAGESKRVVVMLEGTGSVRARVVDEQGLPLHPARLMRSTGNSALGWARTGPSGGGSFDGMTSFAGPDGVVTLRDVTVGEREFSFESPGFRPKVVRVVVKADQLQDLGDIVLEAETSGVTFVLKAPDGADPTAYRVSVYISGGTRLDGEWRYFNEQGRASVHPVAAGAYIVFVKLPEEAGGWSKTFDIPEGEIVEVVVDTNLAKGGQ